MAFNGDFDQVQGKYGEKAVEMASFGGDAGCVATFYRGRIPHEGETLERAIANKEPTFIEADFVRIEFPGNTRTVYDQPVILKGGPLRPSDPERFPRQWAAYKSGQARASGTALTEIAMLAAGDIRKFESLNIYTAEDLANVSDGNLSNLGLGGREAREAARALLLNKASSQAAPASDEIAFLRAQIEELKAAQAKPRGRRAAAETETTDEKEAA